MAVPRVPVAEPDGTSTEAGDLLDDLPDAPVTRARRKRVLVGAVLVVLLAVIAAAGWLVYLGTQVAGALRSVDAHVGAVTTGVRDGDLGPLAAAATPMASAAQRAYDAAHDPVWRAAAHLPVVGRQLDAVTVTTESLREVTTDAVPALVAAGAQIDPTVLVPTAGRLDLRPLTDAAPLVERASVSVDAAAQGLAAVPTDDLWPLLRDRIEPASARLTDLAAQLGGASRALEVVPRLLGAQGPRTYLVLVLNPAELRSAGGIVGSVLEVSTDDGEVVVQDQRAARDLVQPREPVVELTDAERALLGDAPGRFMQSVTASPDFARTAELASALWARSTGGQVDGVVTIDPVVLAAVLRATGPLQLPDGTTLDAGSVVGDLLSDAYVRYPDPAATDEYFGQVAATVAAAALGGVADGRAMLEALREGSGDGRIRLWTSDDVVTDLLAGTPFDGSFLLAPDAAAEGAAGVFLNDATVSKMDYYLDVDVSGALTCSAGATGVVRTTLTSRAPLEASTTLPSYVTGAGRHGTPAGSITTQVLVYSPLGAQIAEVRLVDGTSESVVGARTVQDRGREAVAVTVTLAPGEASTLEVELRLAEGSRAMAVRSTQGLAGKGGGTVARC